MTLRTVVFVLASTALGCGSQLKPYEVVDQRAKHTYLVYVPPQFADDRGAYEQAIRDICDGPSEPCIVMFWNDRSKVWRDPSEMTSQQAAAQVAGYLRDPSSGLNSFFWLRDGDRVDEGPVELSAR